MSYLVNVTPLKILQCLCIAMYVSNSCVQILSFFRAHSPIFTEALVEAVDVFIGSFMGLVVVCQSFCTMIIENTHKNSTNLFF